MSYNDLMTILYLIPIICLVPGGLLLMILKLNKKDSDTPDYLVKLQQLNNVALKYKKR